uniref:F-box protein At3g26010-like beta-propeller domain-containing protein n=1 Tax=Aegilops tauschii TaxID=37682 RepID=M8BJ95_AEGTA
MRKHFKERAIASLWHAIAFRRGPPLRGLARYLKLWCNPATQKWEVVPATDSSCQTCVPRLGFNPVVSSQFHVFEFIDQRSWGIDDADLDVGNTALKGLVIYSSKAGTWKYQTAEFDSFEMPENPTSTFLKGIMHLAVYDNVMVAVDVEGDNWWCVYIPMTTPRVRTGDVLRSQGQLYFANSTTGSDDSELDVWVLEDYRTSKWTLKHNVSHLQLLGRKYLWYAHRYSVISIHPEHNLVFVVCGDENALMSYDMDSGKWCIIRQLGWDCGPPYVPYVPLFSESLGDGH